MDLNITATAGAGGSISPPGNVSVPRGSNRTFTITPNTGYFIDQVLVNGVPALTTSEYEFTNVTSNQTISVTFAQNAIAEPESYVLSVTSGAGGTVSGTTSGNYAAGHPVSVTATPNTGFHFTGWTITGASITGGAMAKPATFSMPANAVTLTANFAPNPSETYTLNVIGAAGGTVSGTTSGSYAEGHPVSVIATADTGFHFHGWTITGAEITGGVMAKPATFDMPANTVTITATFEPNPPETYTLNVIGGRGGTVSGTLSDSYAEGFFVSVTAEANSGYHFTGWTITGAEIIGGLMAKPATFNMPANAVTLTANFEPNPPDSYTLNVIGGEGGTISGTHSGHYAAGHTVSVTAAANTGYRFAGWTITGASITGGNTANPAQFVMPGNAVTLTAVFEVIDGEPTPTPSPSPEPTPSPSPSPSPDPTAPPATPSQPGAPQTSDSRNHTLPIILLVLGLLIVTGAELYRRGLFRKTK